MLLDSCSVLGVVKVTVSYAYRSLGVADAAEYEFLFTYDLNGRAEEP